MRPIRVAASQVAAVCGYQPFADPIEVFLDAVYQDKQLFHDDAAQVGLRMSSQDEHLAEIINSLPSMLAAGVRNWPAVEPAIVTPLLHRLPSDGL